MVKAGGYLSASLALSALFAAAVSAQQPRERGAGDVSLWVGLVSSDNVSRTVSGDRGSYETVGVALSLANTSRRFDGELSADFEFRNYSEEGLDDERVGNLFASARIGIVPERFTWLFQDVAGQSQTDLFAPVGPQNREGTNVFSTGPELDISFGGRTHLRLSSIWTDRTYGESVALDSESLTNELGLLREINTTTTVGLIASRTETEYDSDVLPYDIDSVRLSYEKTLASGGVIVEGGENELLIGGAVMDGPLFNFAWTRSLTARSTLRVAAAREFTDSGSLFEVRPENGVQTEQDVVLSTNPVEQRRVEMLYSWMLPRSDVSLGLSLTDDLFVGNNQFDNQAETAVLRFSRAMTPSLELGLEFEEVRRDIPEAGRDDRDTSLTVALERQFSGRFSLSLSATQYERRGTDEMDERRYELRFIYSATR